MGMPWRAREIHVVTIEELEAAVLAELQDEAEALGVSIWNGRAISVPTELRFDALAKLIKDHGHLRGAALVADKDEYDGYVVMHVSYTEPKSAKELVEAIAARRAERAQQEKWRREAELRELARLKAKYEENDADQD